MGGGEHHGLLGPGEVWLSGGPRGLVVLRSVLLVPNMSFNLVWVFLAMEAGHDCLQRGDICMTRDPE